MNMNKQIKNWTYNEGKALISAYESSKEEYFRTKNKQHFWVNILQDLEALEVLVSPTTAEQVKVKWSCLFRAYKNAKDRGTGTSATRFLYMEAMEAIFSYSPVVNYCFAVSVGLENSPSPATITPITEKTSNKENSISPISNTRRSKKKDPKTIYYEKKLEEKIKTREMLQNYLDRKEQAREERHQEFINLVKSLKKD